MASWDERVAAARLAGARVVTPNNLPISVIAANREGGPALLEHEHADHPEYKFPVLTTYLERLTADGAATRVFTVVNDHALVFSDGQMVMTLFEMRYFVGMLSLGPQLELLSNAIQRRPSDGEPQYRLTPDSIDVIRLFGREPSVFNAARSAFRTHPAAEAPTLVEWAMETGLPRADRPKVGRLINFFKALAGRRSS